MQDGVFDFWVGNFGFKMVFVSNGCVPQPKHTTNAILWPGVVSKTECNRKYAKDNPDNEYSLWIEAYS